jgi:hypothetical protein
MGRHETTRKWVKKQSEGSRPHAEAGNGRGKTQKLLSDNPEDTSATPLVSHGKVVNMSIIHSPQVLEKFPENTAFTFPHLPLDSSKSEIRIIILKPSTVSVPLGCTLQHVPMPTSLEQPTKRCPTLGVPHSQQRYSYLMASKYRSARISGKPRTIFAKKVPAFGSGLRQFAFRSLFRLSNSQIPIPFSFPFRISVVYECRAENCVAATGPGFFVARVAEPKISKRQDGSPRY